MKYKLSEIALICKAELFPQDPNQAFFDSVITDSRSAVLTANALFIAIVGDRNDGHHYLMDMYNKGVRNFLISKPESMVGMPKDASLLLVENTVLALQQIARNHRSKFNIPIISVTGSNGKTIVKEWLFQLISPYKKVLRSPKSYNSQIGVPLSVLALDDFYEIAIFEAGISKPDEMQNLADIIQPNIVVFTNIGSAHDENFIHLNQKVAEKLNLAKKAQKLIYCSDHHQIRERIFQSELDKVLSVISWSKNIDADLRISEMSFPNENNHSIISAVFNDQAFQLELPFNDQASIENAINCCLLLLTLGFNHEQIQSGFKKIQSVEMRLEMVQGINNCVLVNDYYNSDLTSLQIALEYISHQSAQKKRCVILSDILQSGKPPKLLYEEVSRLLDKFSVHRMIGIGSEISKNAGCFNMNASFYLDTDHFFAEFRNDQFNDEIILLKGARVFRFERIAKLLSRKSHVTVMEINLNSLVDNYNYFRSKLGANTGIIAMVKAFAYGSGAVEIARVLEFNHVNYLAVAYADEGVSLRLAGINVPIIVMNPVKSSFYQMAAYQLEPEIYSFRILEDWLDFLKSSRTINQPMSIHLKIDTGMHRLGFSPDEMSKLIQILKESEEWIQVSTIFSHFSSSENSSDDAFSHQQVEKLNNCHKVISEALNLPIKKHICNSNGVLRFPQYHFDFVRLGIGLFGETADATVNESLSQVASLKTKISQIRYVPAGESIGYSRKSSSDMPRLIATIPVGYADGIDRRLSEGNGVFVVKGIPVPTVGLICMDMCMLDVTSIPDVSEDDTVIIFGKEMPLRNFAESSGKIVYEALTSISDRVNRHYIKE